MSAVLLVRQCILHGLVKDVDLGTGALGNGQGLSLFWADYHLGQVTYDMMPGIVADVHDWAVTFWAAFQGTVREPVESDRAIARAA